MKRHNLALISITVFMIAGIQCRQESRTQSQDSTLVIGTYGDERIFLQDYWGMEAAYMIFLPLVAGTYGSGEPQPALAVRWSHSEDYKEWTFYLRNDVKWHDGVPVTAHDIKFTLDLRRKQNLGTGSAEVLDDDICKITFQKPKNGLESSYVYYPKHLLEGLDPDEFFDWDFWTQPIGNGPYRYVRHIPKTMVELEANPAYYRGKPKIGKVILKFGGDTITDLKSGNVDAAGEMNRLDLLAIKNDPRFRSYFGWGNMFSTIYWNHDIFLFQNPEVRRALTLAINRVELAEVLNYPEDVPLKDTISTIRQFLQGDFPDPLPNDPDQAREILEKHGWRDTNGNGIRERDGKEMRFVALFSSSLPGSQETSIYIQDQFRKIGVRMEIQPLQANVLKQRIRNSDFEAVFFLIDGSLTQPNFGDARLFGTGSPLNYRNPEMIRLLDLALLAIEPDTLDDIYKKIMSIFIEDMPMTFLLPQVYTSIAHKRIKGLRNQTRVDPIWNIEHLWIEKDK